MIKLSLEHAALLIIDVQDKLFSHVERSCEVMLTMQKMIKAADVLQLPIYVTEQYPQGLGPTIATLKNLLNDNQVYYVKNTFSCIDDQTFLKAVEDSGIEQWIVMGIEAHVCVLQTAKDLIHMGKQVVVLNDAITSRSIYDFSTAISEMKDEGIRISSSETVLFELLRSSQSPYFKKISELIKSSA